MVFRTIITNYVAKRIPTIKFRKGGGASDSSAHNVSAAELQNKTSGRVAAVQPAIEDWQLPARYRRRDIDQFEIDYINRGGPE